MRPLVIIMLLTAPILSMTGCGSLREVVCESSADPPTQGTERKQNISKDIERRTYKENIERQHSSISVVDDASDNLPRRE